MALIQCPECGKEISEKALSCPYCGVPLTLKRKKFIKQLSVIVLSIFSLAIIIFMLSFFKSKQKIDISEIEKSVFKVHCLDKNGDEIASGSGFLFFDDKTIVTNLHVLAAGYTMYVETSTGEEYKVDTLQAYSEGEDLVILGLEKSTGLEPLKESKGEIQKGDKIYAIGSPKGLKNTISDGLVSELSFGKDDRIELIQISAPISPGSSGGVLLNTSYEVIGVTSSGVASSDAQNLNFAIPIWKIKELYNKKTKVELEALIERLHSGDHDCYFTSFDKSNALSINEAFDYCSDIDGKEIVLYGYYSSRNQNVIYLYSDINNITKNNEIDKKRNEGLNTLYYYNKDFGVLPIVYDENNIRFHTKNTFEPGDILMVYCKIEGREVYGFSYNPDDSPTEQIREKEESKYFDYYSYGAIAKEIAIIN